MKKAVMISLMVLMFTGFVFADPATRNQLNGVWIGVVYHDDDSYAMEIKIEIQNNRVIQYFNNNGRWEPVEPDEDYYIYNRNNFVYLWVNKGGVWSETQIYSLSFINERTLNVIWVRHVNNYRNGGNNEDWHLSGQGQLIKN